MDAVFKAKRAATRATLLCFHVATRLRIDGETPVGQRMACSVMRRLPMHILMGEILIHADFEFEWTLYRCLPKSYSASVLDTDLPILVWTRNVDDWWTMVKKWMIHSLWIFGMK
jgi:hypothetical protein